MAVRSLADLMRPRTTYETRYGYPPLHAYVAEFWWRVEHLGVYRGGDGGLFGWIRGIGYAKRKQAERRGASA